MNSLNPLKYFLIILLIVSLSANDRVLPDFAYDFVETTPIQYGIMENKGLFYHTIGGTFMARVVNSQTIMGWVHLKPVPAGKTLLGVAAIAVSWEVIEYAVEGTKPYGSTEKWFWDSAGDVGGALLGASLAVRYHLNININNNNDIRVSWEL